jgi:hypothetical protein
VTEERERILGWRLWRIREGFLGSWALNHDWMPGPNRAKCLSPNTARCSNAPGRHCRCGFWGLHSPLQCLTRARYGGMGWWPVMGLMRGWGTVAVHGDEGFRAENASVVCLFSDWPFMPREMRLGGGRWTRWWRLLSLLMEGETDPPPPDQNDRRLALRDTADRYGVPLVSLSDSIRLGLLEELDVGQEAVDELKTWLAVGPWGKFPTR